jgi:hypothetical protein
MPKYPSITAAQLQTASSARFYALPKPLTAKFVKGLFKLALEEIPAKRAAPPQVRVEHGNEQDGFVHSFLCYRIGQKGSVLQYSN